MALLGGAGSNRLGSREKRIKKVLKVHNSFRCHKESIDTLYDEKHDYLNVDQNDPIWAQNQCAPCLLGQYHDWSASRPQGDKLAFLTELGKSRPDIRCHLATWESDASISDVFWYI